MTFLFINAQELTLLEGLPYLQQLVYLIGIRPYMDRQTLQVGIKRRISYQSLAEALYIEPHPGIQSGSPGRQQLRRALKGLERVGLVTIESLDKQLIVRCLLAKQDYYGQNKADTKPTCQANIKPTVNNPDGTRNIDESSPKPDMGQPPQADTPHKSENKPVFLKEKFAQFWLNYPQPQNREKAWEEFKKLDPSDVLFAQLLNALQQQREHYRQQQAAGHWVPHWKYPANWLAQQCWNDDLLINVTMETPHANHSKPVRKPTNRQSTWDIADDVDFDFEDTADPSDPRDTTTINNTRAG